MIFFPNAEKVKCV